MCQFTPRCNTIKHRPGTICPVAGRTPHMFASPAPPPPRLLPTPGGSTPASNSVRGSQLDYRIPAAGAGVSVLDLLIWLPVLTFTDAELTLGWMAALTIVVLLPLVIFGMFTDKCGAWIMGRTHRCARGRRGPFRRCQDHKDQVVTAYDLAGSLAVGIAIINAAAFFFDAA